MRTLRALAVLVLLPGLYAPVLGQPSNQTEEVKDIVRETFEVRPGGTLRLDLDRGDVEVSAGRASDRVEVVVERTAQVSTREEAKRVWERHRLRMSKQGDDVVVNATFDAEGSIWGRRNHNQVRIRVVVSVPRRYNVAFSSGAGNIAIREVEGLVRGRTGAGNVQIDHIDGSVNVSSGSGNVRLARIAGDVELQTGAGNIEVLDATGQLSATTGAGNVQAVFSRQPRGDARLESGAGNVTASVRSGVGLDVSAATGMGAASADFGLRIEGRFMSKSFGGAINGGGPVLRLRSGVGNVRLVRQ